jgi:hypothetical protein
MRMSETRASDRDREIDDLLVRLAGLVRVRSLLEKRGATEIELEEHGAEIGRLHWRLARTVKQRNGGP